MKLEVSAILFFVLNAVESRKMKKYPCENWKEEGYASLAECVNF